jgi:hypothetical protein
VASANRIIVETLGTSSPAHSNLFLVNYHFLFFYKFDSFYTHLLWGFISTVTIDDKLWVLDSVGSLNQLLTSWPLKSNEGKRRDEILHLDEDWVLL